MREVRWMAIAEDGNGKIHVFSKWIDETEPNAVEDFRFEVEHFHKVTILALYREDDGVSICRL